MDPQTQRASDMCEKKHKAQEGWNGEIGRNE